MSPNRFSTSLLGTVALVLTVLVSTACSTATPVCPQPAAAEPVLPVPTTSPALGTKTDWSSLGPARPYLRSLRGGPTFYEVTWCEVQLESGEMDWRNPDAVVDQAHSLGFITMLKIRVGECPWLTGEVPEYLRGKQAKTESSMPLDLTAYAGFVKQVVERYEPAGVNEYAVENEVNSESFWNGTVGEYRTLVAVAARVIHRTDGDAAVADAGMSSVASGYGVVARLLELGEPERAIDAYNAYFSRRIGTRGEQIVRVSSEAELRDALATEKAKRNLAYMRVTERLVARGLVDARQIHFYEEWSSLPLLLEYLHATTPATMPLELWELGAYLGHAQLDDKQRTVELVKVISLALGGGVTKVVWIPLFAEPDSGEELELYGLLSSKATTRPASTAFAALDAAADKSLPVAINGSAVVGTAFQRHGRGTAFVWARCAPAIVSLPAGSRVGGAASAGAGRAGDTMIGDEPVRIDFAVPVRAFLRTVS
ncbi:MAG TPA: hypothetical protein VES21_08085 [Nocardioidaceae bacterium]|nr:hypothetical protein [Nocardioidaceae bacterium]